MNCESALFFEVCQLFEDLSQITANSTSFKRTNFESDTGSSYYLNKEMKKQIYQIISNWFSKFTSGSLLSIFRLLVPEEDIGRVYYLKEKRLSHLLISVLGLERSCRANELSNWNESVDLSGIIHNLISNSEHVIKPYLTVYQLNILLENLSNVGKSSLGKDFQSIQKTLSEIYLSMTSIEAKWITRIILKNLRLSIEPKFYFDSFHGWMWKVYMMKNDLEKTCKVITEIIMEGYTCSRLNDSISFAKIAQKYFQPELGTNISIMECGRGKGIDHVAKELKGKVCYIETKYDGERLQAHFDSSWTDPIKIFSKSGRNSTFNRRLCCGKLFDSMMGSVKNCILEGELLVFNESLNKIEPFGSVQDLGRKEFREKGILLGKRHFLIILYDLLYLNGECLMRRPLNERKRLLSLNIKEIPNHVQLSPVRIIDLRPVSSSWYANLETFRQIYMESLDRKEEGLIIKNADSFYIPGDRYNWWKLKKDYIEGYGDTADFAIVGALKSKIGLFDTFIAACLTNKFELENDPCKLANFEAIFTVSLGLTRSELELLQGILEEKKELNLHNLNYQCNLAKGFKLETFGCCWLKEPLVFELLSSGFIRERGMWCYSLRFPRIRRIKVNSSFMECLTFKELQELGRNSISTTVTETTKLLESSSNVYDSKSTSKRVKFVFNQDEEKNLKLKKSDYFIHLSHEIKLKEREQLINWFDFRGFELIWSLDAALTYSDRKLIIITCTNCDHFTFKDAIFINLEDIDRTFVKIDNAYFWLTRGNTETSLVQV